MRGNIMQEGYQLIELMIAVTIVGLLAAITLPNFSQHVMTSYRLEAQKTLLATAAQLEQTHIEGKFSLDDASYPNPANNDHYRFVVEVKNQRYLLSAIPQGKQREDECGMLTLDSTGRKGANENVRECWR